MFGGLKSPYQTSFLESYPASERVKRYKSYLKLSESLVLKAGFEDLTFALENCLKLNGVTFHLNESIEGLNHDPLTNQLKISTKLND